MLDWIILRSLLIATLVLASYYLQPFGLSPQASALVGGLIAILVLIFEIRLNRVSMERLIGAAAGSIMGIICAYMMDLVLNLSTIPRNTLSFLQIAVLLLGTYIGVVVGAAKGEMLDLSALGGIFGGQAAARRSSKILDTSVIIDGRIADICEAGFLDGLLVIPKFVLRELQQVADSADSMKRNRGRRGLDILQKIQKMSNLNVQVVDDDFPQVREVDLKLIELARKFQGKIVTNDFNLNKVAQLQGVEILNINELANALKPVVLPGEVMRVFILKEGKEYNQGVAYLDDGTMVVVDNARKMISKTIDVSVTSVLQTTAGKMIFGKYDERAAQREASQGNGQPPMSAATQRSERAEKPEPAVNS